MPAAEPQRGGMARVAPPEEGAAATHGEFGDIIKSRSGKRLSAGS